MINSRKKIVSHKIDNESKYVKQMCLLSIFDLYPPPPSFFFFFFFFFFFVSHQSSSSSSFLPCPGSVHRRFQMRQCRFPRALRKTLISLGWNGDTRRARRVYTRRLLLCCCYLRSSRRRCTHGAYLNRVHSCERRSRHASSPLVSTTKPAVNLSLATRVSLSNSASIYLFCVNNCSFSNKQQEERLLNTYVKSFWLTFDI